jgi:antitoxin HicB
MKIERKMSKSVAEYLALPYTFKVRRDKQDEIFVARVEELPGCSAHGATAEEALANLRDNMKDWVEDCLESGEPVPQPAEDIGLPSGKWLQRVPRSLHLKLIRVAKEEGVSLNQLVTSALAEAVGAKTHTDPLWPTVQLGVAAINQGFAGAQFPILTAKYEIRNEIGLPITVPMTSDPFVGVLGSSYTELKFETGQERSGVHAKVKEQSFKYHS